jgi:hypothetical protein
MRRVAPQVLVVLALLPAFACAAPPEDQQDLATLAQIASEQESFAPLDSTDDELGRATAEARAFEHELTVFAIPAPKLTGLSWGSPGALARRTLIGEGLGLSHAIGHAAIRVDCGATGDGPPAHFQGSMTDTGNEFRRNRFSTATTSRRTSSALPRE